MMSHQVFTSKDQRVFPDQAITFGEFLKMLVILMNHGQDFEANWSALGDSSNDDGMRLLEPYIEKAIELGLISEGREVEAEQILTREHLAYLFVKALEYHKQTSYPGVFNQNWIDVGQTRNL